MHRIFFILIGLCLHINMQAQTNFGKSWLIGQYGYSVEFDMPAYIHDTTIFANVNAYFTRGKSNICDSNGNLILLCNGMNIYDANGNFLDGGDTLIPKNYYNEALGISHGAQESLFLPVANKKYYMVTPTMNDTQFYNCKNIHPWKAPFNLMLYNVIDMNANAGAGKVTQRMKPILENKEIFKTSMQACRHANGKDWWLLKQGGDSSIGNVVYKFLFTQDSVYDMGMQTIPFPFRGYPDLWGQMAFSKDGKRWACTLPNNKDGEVYLGDFDRCTGMLSNFQKKNIYPQATGFPIPGPQQDTTNAGLCFSPNGNLLYISRYSHIVQLSLQNNSQYKVYGMDTAYNYFMGYIVMYLGPDNKIYIGHKDGFSKQMSTIDNPDVQGAGCNFCRKCLRSQSYYGYLYSPPNMPDYELGADLPCWPLGYESVAAEEEVFSIYPNPSSGMVTIKTDSKHSRELYNSMGQQLMSTFQNEIDMKHYSKGIYYIKCDNAVKKLVLE